MVLAICSMADGIKSVMLQVLPSELLTMVSFGAGVGLLVLWWWSGRTSISKDTTLAMNPTDMYDKHDVAGVDVFVSYSVRDRYDALGHVIPDNIIDQMMAEFDKEGITYWIDKEGLSGGTIFPAEIAKQIKNAKCMVYVSSANSNASMWTMNEIATAQSYGKTIIPLRADSTPYAPAIMIYIAGIHYIDYAMNPTRALALLVEAVKRILENEKK